MIGIVGRGFVGEAVYQGFRVSHDVLVYDTLPERSQVEKISDLNADVTFVCVPTPMFRDGTCDVSIVENVVRQLTGVVVIKSTVPPGTTERLARPDLTLVFNPEFLTEANYINDFCDQTHVVLGGKNVEAVAKVYRERFPGITVLATDSRAAEMVKYVTNTYLATKLAWANEIYQICSTLNINYADVMETATTNDPRIGKSHSRVPGPDGKMGFGKSCLPKDLNGLIAVAKGVGLEPKLLEAVWEKNLSVRPERDWEKLTGRAITRG